jgi:hypothetical protein
VKPILQPAKVAAVSIARFALSFPIRLGRSSNRQQKPMKPPLKRFANVLAVCAVLLLVETSCESSRNFFSTTRYSESGFQTAESVKKKSLALIDKARGRAAYADFAREDTALMQEFDSAIASEKQRSKNQPTVAQWQIVKGQMRRFLDLWKKKEKLSPAFVEEEKKQVEKAFAILLKTEQEKRHS